MEGRRRKVNTEKMEARRRGRKKRRETEVEKRNVEK